MRKNMSWWKITCGLAVLCLALAGCGGGGGGGGKASLPQPAPASTSKTDLLLAAGFHTNSHSISDYL
jgi:hypothetical protein